MTGDVADLARHFVEARAVFSTSPLYRHLCGEVAADPQILALLAHRRAGQQPSYLFFGAVHDVLLSGVDHPLREYYPSLAGDAARDPTGSGPVLRDFCAVYEAELDERIRTRLVQTNVVRRAIALRYAMWAIGRTSRAPVHLVEVGASAGLLLFVDQYRYRIGDHEFGRPGSPVVLDAQWRSGVPPPDLDDVPPIASRIGIDLNPAELNEPTTRRWLRALVWPEDGVEAALYETATAELLADPPTLIAGDAIDVCSKLVTQLPADEPRVVFHAATRMHVPAQRRIAFDDAIDAMGKTGPLHHVWLEPPDAPHHGQQVHGRGVVAMHGPDGALVVAGPGGRPLALA